MGVMGFIECNRRRINKEFAGTSKNYFFSATTASLYFGLLPVIQQYAKGRLLDAGAGDLQYKALLKQFVESYESFDIEKRQKSVDYLGDVQDMREISSSRYDVVFCNQVLEHVSEPQKALMEFYRILKPGGVLLLAVPHLSRLHEEPQDFYRYTQYGVTHLLGRAGFNKIETYKTGGLFSFLSHQVSTVFLSLVWNILGVKWLAYALNKIFLVHAVIFLDRLFKTSRKFPLNIIAIGRKDE